MIAGTAATALRAAKADHLCPSEDERDPHSREIRLFRRWIVNSPLTSDWEGG